MTLRTTQWRWVVDNMMPLLHPQEGPIYDRTGGASGATGVSAAAAGGFSLTTHSPDRLAEASLRKKKKTLHGSGGDGTAVADKAGQQPS